MQERDESINFFSTSRLICPASAPSGLEAAVIKSSILCAKQKDNGIYGQATGHSKIQQNMDGSYGLGKT